LWGCIFTLAALGSVAAVLVSEIERRMRWQSQRT
jgi:hypothetical protein